MAVTGFNVNILKMTAAADAQTGRLHIDYIKWVGATTASHTLSVTNTAGAIIFESEADGANFIDLHPMDKWVNGVIVATMDSGTLYVFLR